MVENRLDLLVAIFKTSKMRKLSQSPMLA